MKSYVFFDIEATSSSVDHAQILEIAALKEGAPPFVAYLRVESVPDEENEIWNLVGFTKSEYEQKAQDPKEALKDFLDYVGDLTLAGHNVLAYDIPVLQRTLERLGFSRLQNPVLDTLRLAHLVVPTPSEELNGYGLTDLYRYFTKKMPERPHEALADVEVNVEVARHLKQAATGVPTEVHALWAALNLEEAAFLSTTPPDEEGLRRALQKALSRDAEVGWIYSEGPSLPRVWEHPDAFKGLLGDKREPQLQMMKRVADALQEGSTLLVEAPTGTGKTRGYLFPALAYANAEDEEGEALPTIVATHTKILQEQAMAELRSVAAGGYAVSAVNLKTSRDYLCLDALKEAFEEREAYNEDARAMVALLLHYASQGGHDLEALPAFWRSRPGFREVRYRVETNPHRCGQGLEHRHCALTLVNDRKKKARIWVTNQAWLLSHQAHESNDEDATCCRLLLDEAHNLEGQATASFSLQIEGEELTARIKRLYDPNRNTGLLRDRSRLKKLAEGKPSEALLEFAQEFRRSQAIDLLRKLQQLEDDLGLFIKQYGQGELKYGVRLDLAPSIKAKNEWHRIVQSLEDARKGLYGLQEQLKQLVPRGSRLHYRLEPLYDALDRFLQLSRMAKEAAEGRLNEREWVLELVLTEATWQILAQPVDLVRYLHPLWNKVRSLVLTSATLDLGDDFAYIQRALGLENAATLKLPGSLPYNQAHLFVPGHLPEFRASLKKRFLNLYEKELAIVLPHAKRSLTLFNSTERMEKLGTSLKQRLEAVGQPAYLPLTRKEREDAVQQMRAHPGRPGHTFGSRAFMEGVDLPNLKVVNLERIPFPVPSRLLEARGNLAEEAGLDPWQDVYLPKAILSFVQAFGRLIRDQREEAGAGAFILWDKRIVNAFYQTRFLEALPPGVQLHFPGTRNAFYDELAPVLAVPRDDLPQEELLDGALKQLMEIRSLRLSPLEKAARIAEVFWEGVDLAREAEREARQREAITAALEGKNLFVFLPTGYGKSLTFQLPALVEGGLTLVISPLKALMADQVSKLQDQGLPAAKVDSSMPAAERAAVYDEVRSGRIHLLYVSPERVVRAQGFRRLLKEMGTAGRLKRFVFDEAHAIIEWGEGFRPDYQEAAKQLRGNFPNVPVSALTATAVRELKEELRKILKLEAGRVKVVEAHPDRPEIRYYTKKTRGEGAPIEKLQTILQVLEHLDSAKAGGSVIVYATTRRMTERLAWALGRLGYRAEAYHGGLSDLIRTEVQTRFESGETPIVVATKAFGMGIDKADVRAVVHFQPPENLEAYLQESGRAGRDGREAYALLCHARGDWKLLQWIASKWSYDENHVDGLLDLLEEGRFWGYGEDLLQKVNELANEGRDEEEHWEIGFHELNQILSRAAMHGVVDFDYLPGKAALLAEDCKKLGELGKSRGGRCEVDFTKLAPTPDAADQLAGELYNSWKEGRIKLLRFYEPSIRILLKDRGRKRALRNWIKKHKKAANSRIEKVKEYAHHPGCLRGFLLNYLGAAAVECAGCLYHDGGEPMWSLSSEVSPEVIQNAYQPREVILEFLVWLQNKWENWQKPGEEKSFNGYGAARITNTLLGNATFWVGSETTSLPSWLTGSRFFGKLAFVKHKEIEKLLGQLNEEGFVDKKPFKQGFVFRISEKGREELQRLLRKGKA